MFASTIHSCRGEPIPSSVGPVDILLAADCVYFEPTFPLLVQTLSDLVKSEEIVVLFCYKKRRKVPGFVYNRSNSQLIPSSHRPISTFLPSLSDTSLGQR